MFSKIKLMAIALVFSLIPLTASAQVSSIIPSEKHYYTVQLRSDERTLNYANVIFENKSSGQETNSYKFRLPDGVTVQKLTAQQVLAKRDSSEPAPCLTYETYDEWQARTNYGISSRSSIYGEQQTQSQYEKARQCLERSTEVVSEYDEDYDFDNKVSSSRAYYDYYYYSKPNDEFHYSDLKIAENNGEYTVELTNPIKPGKQGSVLISYIADGVVSGALGVYNYDYRTLVSDDMISSVTAAINFDEGLYSRDVQQKREVESSSGSIRDGVSSGMSAAPSRSTDNVLFSVGQGGVYTKTQTNLLPGDVMSIKGIYAEKPYQLFLKEIIITLLVITAIVVWAIAGRRYYLAKHPKIVAVADSGDDSNSSDKTNTDAELALKDKVAKLAKGEIRLRGDKAEVVLSNLRLLAVSGISIAIAMAISVLWLGLASIVGNSSYASIEEVFMLVTLISWAALVLFAIFALPLAYVLRHGINNLSRWVFIHFGVLLVVSLIVVLLLFAVSLATGSRYDTYY